MAKYDAYSVSVPSGASPNPVTRTISVLFEDGDTEAEVLAAADLLLIESAGGSDLTLTQQLIDLNESEMNDLLREVWAAQMSTMGNDKYNYANQLRDSVNYAQNNSN